MIRNLLNNIFNRVFILYLLVGLGIFFLTDSKAVFRSARLQALSRLTPSYPYDSELLNAAAPGVARFEECAYYHEEVARQVPEAAGEAWAVASFCRYGQGDIRKARRLLERSRKKIPVYFWNDYNDGIMAVNDGQYEQAILAFSRALKQEPKYTLFILSRSKVHKDILHSFIDQSFDVQRSLENGYQRAKTLLQFSLLCQANKDAEPCQRRGDFKLQIF